MPSNVRHFTTGTGIATLVSLAAGAVAMEVTEMLTGSITASTISFLFLVAGSVAPDVDHQHSHPFRAVKNAAAIIAGAIATYYQLTNPGFVLGLGRFIAGDPHFISSPFVISSMIGVLLILIVTGSTLSLVDYLKPVHRGITHSRLPNVVFTVIKSPLIYLAFLRLSLPEPVFMTFVASISWLIGVSLHLLMDRFL